jgi:hypothetical protein
VHRAHLAREMSAVMVVRTSAERFWYVVGCVAFGAAYFGKIPVKAALRDVGTATMTGAERFWYVLMCIAFGAGYFSKVSVKKALAEQPGAEVAQQ